MTRYRAIKNKKHSFKKMRNRIRRLGDSWYSKEWLYRQRLDGKKEVKGQLDGR
jgi:hypothetical protein